MRKQKGFQKERVSTGPSTFLLHCMPCGVHQRFLCKADVLQEGAAGVVVVVAAVVTVDVLPTFTLLVTSKACSSQALAALASRVVPLLRLATRAAPPRGAMPPKRGDNDGTVDLLVFDSISQPDSTEGARSSSSEMSEGQAASIASIRARIQLIQEERAKLGPPVATPGWPLPSDDSFCKFCKRIFAQTRNPLRNKPCPYLEIARTGSKVCVSCRNTINYYYKGWVLTELEAQIDKSKSFAQKFLICVFLWEDRYNDPHAAVVQGVEELPGQFRVTVKTTDAVAFEIALQLGVLWPVAIYKKHEGKLPAKSQIQTITHNGVAIRGVVREPSFGTPIGTIVLKQKGTFAHSKETKHEESDRSLRGAEACHEVFDTLRKRAGVQLGLPAGDGPEDFGSIKPKYTPQAGSEDPLDLAWTCPIGKRAATKKDSKGQNQTTAGRGRNSTGGKRQSELDQSVQVVVKAKQMLNAVTRPDTFDTVTVKKVQTTLSLITSRVKDSVMPHYTKDEFETGIGEPTTGIAILEDLRDKETKLKVINDVLTRSQGTKHYRVMLAFLKPSFLHGRGGYTVQ